MNKKFQQKEFAKMSNEELCAIAARLKFQLVEARFKMSSGELDKVNVVNQIRKTIARIFTELTNRGYKVSIGSHGVTMYEIAKGNKPVPLDPKKLQEFMEKDEKDNKKKKPAVKAEEKKPAAKEVKKEAAKEVKKGDKK
ncbi:MAG: 50S ribosomal protein L29 [Mycoplasmoidaceae bacterium]|nr:50S ribosomal protein L29 [Mycoplasmoidaceae bacterium]